MTRTSTQDLQEEFLTTLCKGQKTIIGALRIWVDTVTTVTPRLLPLTDKLPNVAVLFAGKLPTPEETVESAYGLAEQLLANQRKFADEVLALTVPLMSGRHNNGNTRTAPWPEPKVVQVTPEPKPAAVVLGPKPAVQPEEVIRDLRARDERDRNRADSPLKPAPDAVLLDSTNMTLEEAVHAAENIVAAKLAENIPSS